MIDYPLNHFNPNSLQLTRKILESRNNPYNYFSQSKTEIVDISREKKLINFDVGNKDILFVSTLDGYIHAIDSNNNELWKISLGKSLINSHLNNYNILEQNSIIPDLEGNIYLYSLNNQNKLTKIDIPIKTLIDSSPFTLPDIPNTIFLGDKKSSVFTIDIQRGIILNKISTSEKVGYINQKPIQTNNLLTVIRTDYTLSSFDQTLGSESWNVTVSEIMAIQKGSKNELAVNWEEENSNNLMGKISKLLENNKLNSIVSIHNYISDSNLPIKIYDNKKKFNPLNEKFDFENYLNKYKDKFFKANSEQLENIPNNNFSIDKNNLLNLLKEYEGEQCNFFSDNSFDIKSQRDFIKVNYNQIFKDYLNYTKNKMRENSKFFNHDWKIWKIFYSFWEFYYFDEKFLIYISMILICIIISLIVIILKLFYKNHTLKTKLNKIRKLSYEKISYNSNNDSEKESNLEFEISDCSDFDNYTKNYNTKNPENSALCLYKNNTRDLLASSEEYKMSGNNNILETQLEKNIFQQERNKIKTCNSINLYTNPSPEIPERLAGFSDDNLAIVPFEGIRTFSEDKSNHISFSLPKPAIDLNVKHLETFKKIEMGVKFLKDSENDEIVKEEYIKSVTKYKNHQDTRKAIIEIEKTLCLTNKTHTTNENDENNFLKNDLKISITSQEKNNITDIIFDRTSINKFENINLNINNNLNHEKIKSNVILPIKDIEIKENIENSSCLVLKKNPKKNFVNLNNTYNFNNNYKDSENNSLSNNISINDKEKSVSFLNSETEKKIQKNNSKENLNNKNSHNNLNLKRKIKEYNILQDSVESKTLLKIDTTYIEEGRMGKNFEDFSKVGEGGFGSVFKAKHKIDDSLYALKIIKLDVKISKSLRDNNVIKEVKTMMKLYHKNVVRYYTCWFQLNVEELKDLKVTVGSETSSYGTTSNFVTNTLSRNFQNKKNKFIKKNNNIHTAEKSLYQNSYVSNTYNSRNYISKSVTKNKNKNNFMDLNNTKSINLNQISENAESDLNSKSKASAAGGFNWDDYDTNKTPSKSKSIDCKSKSGKILTNKEINSYNKIVLSFNIEKNKIIEEEIKNKNNISQSRKFSSLTDDMYRNMKLDKKAISVSLEKNDQEIFSDYSENYKNNSYSKEENYKNKKKQHNYAQDDSIIDISRKNSSRKKEPKYSVYFIVQMEFCDGLSLNQYLESVDSPNGLDKKIIFTFFKQILSGVNQIHKNNIIHRDLKPHNIFVMKDGSGVKIGDFGLAYDLETYQRQKKLNQNHNNFANNSIVKIEEYVGTPLYHSPEQIEHKAYNEKVDIYAMGLILYELCGCFKTGMERRQNIDELRKKHKISQYVYEKYPLESNLILLMTSHKHSDRPSASEILNSIEFKNWRNEFN